MIFVAKIVYEFSFFRTMFCLIHTRDGSFFSTLSFISIFSIYKLTFEEKQLRAQVPPPRELDFC